MKVRVYEIAKKINIKSGIVIKKLNDIGINVTSNFNAIDEDDANKFINEWLKKKKSIEETKENEKPTGKFIAQSKTEGPKSKTQTIYKNNETINVKKDTEKHVEVIPKPFFRRKKLKRDEFIESVKPQILKEKKKYKKPDKVKQESEKTEFHTVKLHEGISVFEFASKINVDFSDIISKMFELGVMARKNDVINFDIAGLIAEEYGCKVEKEESASIESNLLDIEDKPEDLVERPPIVTVMGHVDHGKTSILDEIKKTNVANKEAGGITQHIGAYTIKVKNKYITFIDTPGHEAFTEMRARGTQVTDIVVLVVAADDGVMPQTIEAINHAKAAGVPIVVAINKIDKPNAKVDVVKQELTKYNIIPEEWGGNNLFASVSAKKGLGISDLLDKILLTAEILELKANSNKRAKAIVLEAKVDKQRGPIASVVVKEGTLYLGDSFIVGAYFGKVKALINDKGKNVKELKPSFVAGVLGLHGVPESGDTLIVVTSDQMAKKISLKRQEELKLSGFSKKNVSLENIFDHIQEGNLKELPIILKTDVYGSIEAIKNALEKLSTNEVSVQTLHFGVGAISRSDINLASASNAIIIGFNIRPTQEALKLASDLNVDVRTYNVIYDIIDDVKKSLSGLLSPEEKEEILGRSEVRDTFYIPKVGMVAGCYVTYGKISRNAKARILRDGVILYSGKISSLKRFKNDVADVQQGYECGVGIEGFNDIKIGDIFEFYVINKIKREL